MENAIALILTMLILGLVGLPLLRERKPEEDLDFDEEYEDPELDRLLSKKETALAAIRELEFDHAVGSLSNEDYADLKEKYERKAMSVLKNLDEASEVGANDSDRWPSGKVKKATRAVRGARRRGKEMVCPECGESYDDGDCFCAACGIELDMYQDGGLTCPECGEPCEEGNVFCASCGAKLDVIEQELADDGEDIAEAVTNEKAGKTVKQGNPSSNTPRKRQTGRSSSRKKTADNNGNSRNPI